VVYRDVTRQAKGLYRLKHVGALGIGLAYLSLYNSGWFCHTGPADPSRMCAEDLPDEVMLQRVQRVLLDVDAVPYVPTLFSARNPPKPVSIRLLLLKITAFASLRD
jgi:hypothetical protein